MTFKNILITLGEGGQQIHYLESDKKEIAKHLTCLFHVKQIFKLTKCLKANLERGNQICSPHKTYTTTYKVFLPKVTSLNQIETCK